MDKYSKIIEALRALDGFSDFSVVKVPSYLKKITAIKDSFVLLLFKKVTPIRKADDLSLSPIRINEESLDLTGSPLKDECPFESILDISADLRDIKEVKNWEADEEKYRGIKHEDVIAILNSLGRELSQESGTSVWAICSSDSGRIMFLQKEFGEGWNSRGKVWSEGKIALRDLKFLALKRSHASFVGIKTDEKIQTNVQSQFKLKSNVIIEQNWINTNETILLDTNSDCNLNQVLPVDSADFSAEHYWRQLVILNMIANTIIKYKIQNDKRIDPEYDCGNNTTTTTLLKEQIRATLSEIPMKLRDVNTTSTQIKVSSVLSNTNERDCLTITDKLWDILKFSATYHDLKVALNFIFCCAADNKIVTTQINSNHLAMLIDAISHRELSIPCLTGSEPLELLLEIGLEKARKDYEFIFTNSKICFPEDLQLQSEDGLDEIQPYTKRLTSRKSLVNANHAKSSRTTLSAKSLHKNPTDLDDSILGFRNSRFNQGEVEHRLAKLAQIHLILEHLLLLESVQLTNLNQLITRSLLEKPLVAFKDINPIEHYTLNISVPHDQIVDLTKSKRPNSLRIVMRSMNKFKQVENTFYYTSEAIIPPETFPMNAENLSKVGGVEDDIDQNLYFMYRYLKIKTPQ